MTTPMQKAAMCRIVVYVDPHMGDEYPAMITAVYGSDEQVALTTFQPNAAPSPVRGAVRYDPDKGRGTWHWPERT